MKAIELTEEHKAKLLEMCKALFPKYKFEILNFEHPLANTGKEDLNSDDISNILLDKEGNTIHWFEFCMLYLVEELSWKFKDENFEDIPPYVSNVYGGASGRWNLYTKFNFHYPKACKGGCILPRNPIDYLYEEFKKLKQ